MTRGREWSRAALLGQAAIVALVIAVLAVGSFNAATNLQAGGIASGFGFLKVTAGFDIILHLISYDEQSTYGAVFVVGLINTLVLATAAIVVATVLGVIIGGARLSHNRLIAGLAGAYIELFRNVPALLQIFFWYFAVLRALPGPRESLSAFGAVFLNSRGLYLPYPVLESPYEFIIIAGFTIALLIFAKRFLKKRLGVPGLVAVVLVALYLLPLEWQLPRFQRFGFTGGMVLIPEFVAMLLGLSLFAAAYIAEVVRAGIEAVPRGQWEAAAALGLSRQCIFRRIILPQARRVIIPPLGNQYLDILKTTTLATAIAYPDLMSVFGGTALNQTGQAIEVLSITLATYLLISLGITLLLNRYNARSLMLMGGV